MNEQNQQSQVKAFKTHILLPILFVITLVISIMFIAVEEFIIGLEPLIIWLYFGVSIAYVGVAIMDLFINKERKKNTKIFIVVMCALTIIAIILYLIFYLIAKGR